MYIYTQTAVAENYREIGHTFEPQTAVAKSIMKSDIHLATDRYGWKVYRNRTYFLATDRRG